MSTIPATPPTRATALQIESLSVYSTCEISDALLKIGVTNGGYVPDIEIFSRGNGEDGRIAGEAFTVKMVEMSDTGAPKLTGHFVDLAPSQSIIFISSPPNAKSASFGGLLGLGAFAKQVRGVIIDGRCRDLSELQSLPLPVFARGHSTLGQAPFTRASAVQIPLTIHPRPNAGAESLPLPLEAVTVNPFDVVVADIDGVVVVSPSQLEDVLKIALVGREIDEKCKVDLKAGRKVLDTFGEHRAKKKN